MDVYSACRQRHRYGFYLDRATDPWRLCLDRASDLHFWDIQPDLDTKPQHSCSFLFSLPHSKNLSLNDTCASLGQIWTLQTNHKLSIENNEGNTIRSCVIQAAFCKTVLKYATKIQVRSCVWPRSSLPSSDSPTQWLNVPTIWSSLEMPKPSQMSCLVDRVRSLKLTIRWAISTSHWASNRVVLKQPKKKSKRYETMQCLK